MDKLQVIHTLFTYFSELCTYILLYLVASACYNIFTSNEMFHKRHSNREEVTVLNNEFFINRQDGKQVERITDTHFMIGSIRYHLECQSTPDGTMMYRIFEYDSQIALQAGKVSGDKLTVRFPNTAILYLRHNKNTPEQM